MTSGTLERCSLHGWIPVFTVQGRWQTACMASCGSAFADVNIVDRVAHGGGGVMVRAGVCYGKRTQVHFIDGIYMYDSVFQFLPISSNFAQPTFHRPQSTTRSTLCEGDVLHCMRQMVVTPDTDPPPPPQYSKTAHFRVAFYCGQPKAHLCINHGV